MYELCVAWSVYYQFLNGTVTRQQNDTQTIINIVLFGVQSFPFAICCSLPAPVTLSEMSYYDEYNQLLRSFRKKYVNKRLKR